MMKNDKKKKEVNTERMRYAVPDVCNRFFQVHIRFIILCLVIALSAVIITVSYSSIRSIRRFEPKMSCVFFCEVENLPAAERNVGRYSAFVDVYFAPYEEKFTPDASSAAKGEKYNFSFLGYDMREKYNIPPEGILCVLLDTDGEIKTEINYGKVGLSNGATLNSDQVLKAFKEAMGV